MARTLLITVVMLAALVGASPHYCLSQGSGSTPLPSDTGQSVTSSLSAPRPGEEEEADDGSLSRFRLAEPLRLAAPAFARRLSTLLGAEVRLPPNLNKTFRLEAREWTAHAALNAVAQQLDGAWSQVFILKPAAQSTPPDSRLPSVGRVTLRRYDKPLAAIAQAIAKRTGVPVELPVETPGAFSVDYWEFPAEAVLVNLAAKARLTLVVGIRFVQNETDNERSLERMQAEEECRIFEESNQREELADHLREWMGHDPYAEDFPWDDIPVFFWENLGIDLEDTPDLCDSLRREGERRRVDPNAVPVGEDLPDS